jgi:hypothetical protein
MALDAEGLVVQLVRSGVPAAGIEENVAGDLAASVLGLNVGRHEHAFE